MNELALFAGAGGGLLATHCLLGWRTVCAVEIQPYRREVLLRRQRDGVLELFPIWDDVRTFDGRPWRGKVDIVTAGFPCQPFSVAGQRRGEADERNLWPDTMRVIREVGPRYVLLENVPGLLAHEYFGTIFGQLAEGGYDCRWDCFSAGDEGAPHFRSRLFIFGDTNSGGESTVSIDGKAPGLPTLATYANSGRRASRGEFAGHERTTALVGDSGNAAYAGGTRREGHKLCIRTQTEKSGTNGGGWWNAEPGVGRVVNGLANRIHRLGALGDGQVPAVVVRAWKELSDQ